MFEIAISSTGVAQKGASLFRRPFQGLLEDLLHAIPPGGIGHRS